MTLTTRSRKGIRVLMATALAGCMSLLLVPAASVVAAPAATRHAADRPAQTTAYARPAIVRVLVKYYGTTSAGAVVPVPVFCVGTGALAGTTGVNGFNYVLTATALMNPTSPCEGARAAFQQISGPAQEWGLDHIEVWLGAAYTGGKSDQLGSVRYRIDPSQILSFGGPFAPKLVALPLSALTGAPHHDLPVLQSPQPSDPPAGPAATLMDLGDITLQPLGRDSVVDSEIAGSLYPVELDATQLIQAAVPTATRAPTSTARPTTAATSAPTQTATAPTAVQQVSLGAPVVDEHGRLVGMVITDATGAPVIAPLSQVVAAIGAISGRPGPLMTQWAKGLAAFYATPPDFAGAVSAFTALRSANPDFGEVDPFLKAAQSRTTSVAPLGSPPATATPTPKAPPGVSTISLPVVLGAIGLVLFVVLLAIALMIHRVFEGRRARPRKDMPLRGMPAPGPVRMPTGMSAAPESGPPSFGYPSRVTAPPEFRAPASASAPTELNNLAGFDAGGFDRLASFGGSDDVDAVATQPREAVSSGAPGSFSATAPPDIFGPTPTLPPSEPLPSFLSAIPSDPLAEGATPDPDPETENRPTVVMAATQPAPLSRGASLAPQAAGLTESGVRRAGDPNQDNILALVGASATSGRPQAFGLFIIADGMGGHTNGQEASRRTVEIIAAHVVPVLTSGQQIDPGMLPELLRQGATRANAELRDQNLARNADMGTTLTAALVLGDVAYVANIGDSRTYVFSPDNGLRQITTDHSVVASLVSAGVIRPEDVYTHPRRNQIYRSLGGQHEDAEVDTFQVVLQAGDKLLLCSDGLWEMVRDPQIEAILRTSADPSEAANHLVSEANNNGGEDNISVIVVRMLDDSARQGVPTDVRVVVAPEGAQLPLPGQE